MTTYIIEPDKNGNGFNIVIDNSNGARNTMLGFKTIEEAETWIAKDKSVSDYDHKVPFTDYRDTL